MLLLAITRVHHRCGGAGSWIAAGFLLVLPCHSLGAGQDSPTAGPGSVEARILTLERALELARTSNPTVLAGRQSILAAQHRERDAGKRPNPAFQVDVENWGGSSSEARETTAGVRQTIELGGDRKARAAQARTETDVSRAELTQAEIDVAREVTEDFLSAWQAQERLWQLRSARVVAADAVAAAGERLRAGAASAVERIRAEGNLATTEAEIDKAEGAFAAARRELSIRWGQSSASFDSLALTGMAPPVTTSADSLLERARSHPALLRARALVEGGRARVNSVQAGRIPDLEASGGVRQFSGSGGSHFVASLGLPLPLWSTRSGELAAAEAELRRAELDANAARLQVESAVHGALDRYLAARRAYERLNERAVPSVNEALVALRGAYRAGRLSYVDLAEGQRAALEARLALIEATAEVWRTHGVLDRLVGGQSTEGKP